jgi:hypothetical protein
MIRIVLRYRGASFRMKDQAWRGRDGHQVHFLTWITDDLIAREGPFDSDVDLAARVAEILGGEATLEVG